MKNRIRRIQPNTWSDTECSKRRFVQKYQKMLTKRLSFLIINVTPACLFQREVRKSTLILPILMDLNFAFLFCVTLWNNFPLSLNSIFPLAEVSLR